MLRTFDGPRPLGPLAAPKQLLLLAYLALEGPTPRRSVAERFWPEAARPLSNLSVALATVRRAVPDAFVADDRFVRTGVATDVDGFLGALEGDDPAAAAARYPGPFLARIDGRGLGTELEEWVLATREFLAERYRAALLRWAAAEPDAYRAAALADAALRVAGAAPAEASDLAIAHGWLAAAGHPSTAIVRREAEELGLRLDDAARTPTVRSPQVPAKPPSSGGGPVAPELAPLPIPGHVLVGRAPERRALAQALCDHGARWITLHGPGGIGKTRLALAVAQDLAGSGTFPGGVAWVPLEEAEDVAELPFAVAQALGRRVPATADPLHALQALAPAVPTLWVLDNLEQVRGAGPVLAALMAAGPTPTLLTTSRELSGHEPEAAYAVDGLPFPAHPDAADAADHAAVRMFAAAARRLDARFVLDAGALPAAARVARAVGGAPLGLELAAAWVRTVPLDDLADELERDLALLRRRGGTGPARHTSAEASFDRSWQRLDHGPRRALAALATFVGPFGLGDARAVAEASLPALARLVDAGLLRMRPGGRYTLHPLVAGFARTKRDADPARTAEVHDRHARLMLTAVARWSEPLRDLRPGALARADAAFADARHAWLHALAAGHADLVADAALPLARYADARARLHEPRVMLADAAAATWPIGDPVAAARVHGRALAGKAWLDVRLGDAEVAIAAAEAAIAALEPIDDGVGVRFAEHARASAYYRAGDFAAAQAAFERVAAATGNDPRAAADALGRLAVVAQATGDAAAAAAAYERALAAHRILGNVPGVVTQLLNAGALDLDSGHVERAEGRLEEALALARAHGYDQVLPVLLHNLANAACKRGDVGRARALLDEGLERTAASGERGLASGLRATRAWVELEAGDGGAAEAYAAAALHEATAVNDLPAAQTARVRLAQVLLARGRSSAANALLREVEEHPATLAWARRLAQRLRMESGTAVADAAD